MDYKTEQINVRNKGCCRIGFDDSMVLSEGLSEDSVVDLFEGSYITPVTRVFCNDSNTCYWFDREHTKCSYCERNLYLTDNYVEDLGGCE